LPRVLIGSRLTANLSTVVIRPEFLVDFIARNQLTGEPEGEPFSRYRRVIVAKENGTRLEAVERNGYRGFTAAALKAGELEKITKARELWRIRRRLTDDDAEGFRGANQLLERVVGLVGRDLACEFFFQAEREYWENRNHAARVQNGGRTSSAWVGEITIITRFAAHASTSWMSFLSSPGWDFKSVNDITQGQKRDGGRRFANNQFPASLFLLMSI